MSTRRKFSRQLNFSYIPHCHHCIQKLSTLLNRFHVDHRVISGNISSKCACKIEGRAKDKLVIKFIRRVFSQHKEGKIGMLMDQECKVLNDEEDVCQ